MMLLEKTSYCILLYMYCLWLLEAVAAITGDLLQCLPDMLQKVSSEFAIVYFVIVNWQLCLLYGNVML